MRAFFDRQLGRRLTSSLRRPAVAALLALGMMASLPAASAQAAKAAPTKAAPAPVTSDPGSTSASYGDWVLRCQRIGEAEKAQRLCEVSQTIQAQGQRDPIAQVAFGRLPNDPALRLTVALPPSVSFPSTVEIASTAPVLTTSLQWKRCLPGGCFADAVPGDDVVKGWRALTSAGKLTFKDAGGHDVALPVSFRGLTQALDALGK
jgi:invasion protein IalB